MRKPRSNGNSKPHPPHIGDYFRIEVFRRTKFNDRDCVCYILHPTTEIIQAFDISLPILTFYFSPQTKFRGVARFVETIIRSVPESKQIEPDCIAFIIDSESHSLASRKMSESQSVPRTVIYFPYPDNLFSDQRRAILNRIYEAMGLRDLFGMAGHITNRHELYGRKSELAQISREIQEGHSVGIFGLRRVGKTSLLLAVQSIVEETKRGTVVRIDLDKISYMKMRWWELLELTASQFSEAGLRLRFAEGDAPNHFELAVQEWLRRNVGKHLVIAFDEIEHITPGTAPFDHWQNDYFFFWNTFRSIARSNPRFSFLICGVNAKSVEAPQIGAYQNPIFNGVNATYLSMFDIEQCRLMTKSIAKKILLSFDDDAIVKLHNEFGGHPYLYRQACSILARQAPLHGYKIPTTIDGKLVVDTRSLRDREMIGYCDYVFSHLNNLYEDELVVLGWLSRGGGVELSDVEREYPREVSHLRKYGLIDDSSPPRIKMSFLARYMRDDRMRQLGSMKLAHRAGQQQKSKDLAGKTDLFVFCALTEELQAFLAVVGGQPRYWPPTPTSPFPFFEIEIDAPEASRPLKVIAGSPGDSGMLLAQDMTHHALRRFDPTFVIQVGILAGLRGEVKLCDVVIADQVADYSLEKRTAKGRRKQYRVWPVNRFLRSAATALALKESMPLRVKANLQNDGCVRFGVVATGNYVLADGVTMKELSADWRKLMGVEMEAGGILNALQSSNRERSFLLIKAVSDFGDQKKDDSVRAQACMNAAAVCYEVIIRHGDSIAAAGENAP